jgi:hypothetical protein
MPSKSSNLLHVFNNEIAQLGEVNNKRIQKMQELAFNNNYRSNLIWLLETCNA